MNVPNKDIQILNHILEYCEKIEKTVIRFGDDFDVFVNDSDYKDSVSMNLLQIGELSGRFSDEYIVATRSMVDWRAIKGMRNLFAHNYGSMDIGRIWETALFDIPKLKEYCKIELSKKIS